VKLVSAAAPTGILELETDQGNLRLEVKRGRVRELSREELRRAEAVLTACSGGFRFVPSEVARLQGPTVSLSDLAEAVEAGLQLEQMAVGGPEESGATPPAMGVQQVHPLSGGPQANPLGDLLATLQSAAPDKLLVSRVAVLTQDPRIWRGMVERAWRQRGWAMHLIAIDSEVDVADCDAVVVHHHQASARVGRERAWIELLRRASTATPPVPVVWISPLGDADWVHRLIDAGVSFLMPAPRTEREDEMVRFASDLTKVMDRQLRAHGAGDQPALPTAVSELVGAVLAGRDSDQGIRSLLSLAAEKFTRTALMVVAATGLRCRAGFGFPLNRDRAVLPRGIEPLERVIHSGEVILEIDPGAAWTTRLADLCGVERLSAATAVMPLGRPGDVTGLLVADRDGGPLPVLDELVVLAGRLGGVVLS
jgi:hypothetical protein